jgi:hypothetical protein
MDLYREMHGLGKVHSDYDKTYWILGTSIGNA